MTNIMLVSHCILNKASKVESKPEELKDEYELRNRFLLKAIAKDVQLIQLPCPEFILYGSKRWGHVKEQFSHPYYIKVCKEQFEPILLQIKEYLRYPEKYHVLGIVSVEGSPSCGRSLTCCGNWGGELLDVKVKSPQMVNEAGVFIEVIQSILEENEIRTPIITLMEAIETIE